MESRLQTINNDTVLEITETIQKKSRFSLAALERRKEVLESLIAKCNLELAEVVERITQIENAKVE